MYWPLVLAKEKRTKLVLHSENECQRSVNNLWSCILHNATAVLQQQPIIEVFATIMDNIVSKDVATT